MHRKHSGRGRRSLLLGQSPANAGAGGAAALGLEVAVLVSLRPPLAAPSPQGPTAVSRPGLCWARLLSAMPPAVANWPGLPLLHPPSGEAGWPRAHLHRPSSWGTSLRAICPGFLPRRGWGRRRGSCRFPRLLSWERAQGARAQMGRQMVPAAETLPTCNVCPLPRVLASFTAPRHSGSIACPRTSPQEPTEGKKRRGLSCIYLTWGSSWEAGKGKNEMCTNWMRT